MSDISPETFVRCLKKSRSPQSRVKVKKLLKELWLKRPYLSWSLFFHSMGKPLVDFIQSFVLFPPLSWTELSAKSRSMSADCLPSTEEIKTRVYLLRTQDVKCHEGQLVDPCIRIKINVSGFRIGIKFLHIKNYNAIKAARKMGGVHQPNRLCLRNRRVMSWTEGC